MRHVPAETCCNRAACFRRSCSHGQTYRLALYLLYLYWKDGSGQPIKLSNIGLRDIGISRYSKWRVLADLERVGLISIERRPRRVPLVHLFHLNLP